MKYIQQHSDSYDRLVNLIDLLPLAYLSEHSKIVHETHLIGHANHPRRGRTYPQKFDNAYVIDAAHRERELTQPGD